MSKSYVTIEQSICPICRNKHDSGSLLLDRRLREQFEMHTVTGFAICDPCSEMCNDGYIALVGADGATGNTLKPEDAIYDAEYLWLKRFVADQIFNVPLGDHPFVFIEPAAVQKVKHLIAASQKENEND